VWEKIGRVVAEFHLFYARPLSVHVALHHHQARVDEWKCIEDDERYRYRKPGPGMLLEAMCVHRSDPETTWFVGDMESDELAARAAGIRYFDQEEFFS
jgi:histidinol phosphatase-like enzyme